MNYIFINLASVEKALVKMSVLYSECIYCYFIINLALAMSMYIIVIFTA